MRTYKVQDESRFDGMSRAEATALYARERAGEVEPRTAVMTWDELAAVNELETMDEIAELEVGERRILGQCDPIERLS